MSQIVVGCDLGKKEVLPLQVGVAWAKAYERRLLALHGEPLAGSEPLDLLLNQINLEAEGQYVERVLQGNKAALESLLKEAGAGPDLEAVAESRAGDPGDVLLEEGTNEETTAIILGYAGARALRQIFLGSVTEELLYKATCPVMIVKNDRAISPKKIMVAYDFSHHCDQALAMAKRIQKRFGCDIVLANVVPCYYRGYRDPNAAKGALNAKIEEMITESIEEFSDKLKARALEEQSNGAAIEPITLVDKEGSISAKLADQIEKDDIDLLVIGSHMRGKITELFLGSVASGLIRKSPCSVIVAK